MLTPSDRPRHLLDGLSPLGWRALALLCITLLAVSISATLARSTPWYPLVSIELGIAVAFLALWGIRYAPVIAVGIFGFQWLTGMPYTIAAAMAGAVALGGIAGTLLITHVVPFDARLTRFRTAVVLQLGVSLVASIISASIVVGMVAATQAVYPGSIATLWFAQWAAGIQGVLILTPLALTWIADRRPDRRTFLAAAAGAGCGLALALGPISVAGWIDLDTAREVIGWAVLPVGLVLGLRYSPRDLALFVAIVAAGAVLGQTLGRQIHQPASIFAQLASWHASIAILAITTLVFAAANAERRGAARMLRASEERFRSFTEMGNDWYWEQGADLRFTNVSSGIVATGVSAQQYVGHALWELPFDIGTPILNAYRRLVEARRPFRSFSIQRAMPNGEVRYFLTSGDPVFDTRGQFAGYCGVGRDVTAERWAEDALRDSEQRFASIFHNSAAAIIVFNVIDDGSFRFESCNQTGEQLLDSRAYSLVGERPEACLPTAVADPLSRWLTACVRADTRSTAEQDISSPDGTRRVVMTLVPMRRGAGRIDRVLLIAIDISAQLRSAERVRESERLLAQMFDASPQALSFARLADTKITGVNAAWERMFGLARADAIGRTTVELGLVADPEQRGELWDRLNRGEQIRDLDVIMRTIDGRALHLLFSCETLMVSGETQLVSAYVDVTARRGAEIALRRSQESFAKIFHANPTPMALLSYPGYRFVEVNAAWSDLLGYSRDQALGRTAEEVGIWADQISLAQAQADFSRVRHFRDVERRFRKRSGEVIDVLNSAEFVTINAEDRVIASLIDITARKSAERQLKVSERRFRDFAEAAGEFVWELDAERRLTFVSNRAEQVLGYPASDMLGRRFGELMPVGEEDRTREWLATRAARDGGFRNLECRLSTRAGATVWLQISAVAMRDVKGDAIGLRGTALDITARKLADQRIEDLATRDALTGLPNRLLLEDRLQQGLANAARAGESLAVMFIDLDHFKHINDNFGHAVGDSLLRDVSRRLSGLVRKGDTLSRLGGDEFVVVLEGLKTAADAGLVAQKMIAALSEPYQIEGRQLRSAGSIGVAIYPDDGQDVSMLMRNADIAMYAAKSSGRSLYQFFSNEMNTRVIERASLEAELRRGIESGELRLTFQPRVAINGERITAVDVKLGWKHPVRGLLAAEVFLAPIEDGVLVAQASQWQIEHALRQAKAWADAIPSARDGERGLRIGLRVMSNELHMVFVEALKDALDRHQIEARLVELEIGEAALMRSIEEGALVIASLRALGCRVIVGEFGAGYSSIRYLRRFAVNGVRIDADLTRDLVGNHDDHVIVKAIAEMATNLGIDVLAQAVDSDEQLAHLRQLGFTEYSGALSGEPASAADFERHLFRGANITTLDAHRGAA